MVFVCAGSISANFQKVFDRDLFYEDRCSWARMFMSVVVVDTLLKEPAIDADNDLLNAWPCRGNVVHCVRDFIGSGLEVLRVLGDLVRCRTVAVDVIER